MTSWLMQAAIADVREAASYAKEPRKMTTEEAIMNLAVIRQDFPSVTDRTAIDIAIAALRAQPEPGPQRDYEADIAILHNQIIDAKAAYASIEEEKIELVNAYRDATERADRLWRIVALLQDMLDEKEAGL